MSLPDALRLVPVERRVVEGHVDAGLECLIKDTDPIAGQKEDALIVLESPEENRNQGVSLDVMFVALGQEYIGLVEEQYTVPELSQLEGVLELCLYLSRRNAEVACHREDGNVSKHKREPCFSRGDDEPHVMGYNGLLFASATHSTCILVKY